MTLSASQFNSRLLRPVLISVVVISIVQVAVSLWMTRSSVDGLVAQVVSNLQQGNATLEMQLDRVGGQVAETIDALSAEAQQTLSATLKEQLSREQQQVSRLLVDSVHTSADAMAQLMAQISPPLIWDADSPALTEMIRGLHRDPQVIFGVYFDAEGKPLTRFLDRSDPRVKTLLATGQGKGSVNKVIDAAKKEGSLYLVEQDISPKGVVIGRFVLAVSNRTAIDAASALDQRFDRLVSTTGDQVQ